GIQLPVPEVTESNSYGENEHGRAREASRRNREKVRNQAREAQGADPQPEELARGAGRGAGGAAGAAARRESRAAAQAVRHHRALARGVSQVPGVAGGGP